MSGTKHIRTVLGAQPADGWWEVEMVCNICGREHYLTVPTKVVEWLGDDPMKRPFVQMAWPEGTPEQREKLINGMCDACQLKIFGSLEEG